MLQQSLLQGSHCRRSCNHGVHRCHIRVGRESDNGNGNTSGRANRHIRDRSCTCNHNNALSRIPNRSHSRY